jgi:hypothetical protein
MVYEANMRVNRDRLRQVVEITLEREEEDQHWKGHFDDEETENWIREQLLMGNNWAWCSAHVTVALGDLQGEDWLGGCSYESEENFRQDGYYESMVSEAVEDLAQKIEKIASVHGLFDIEGSLCLQCVAVSS